MRVMTTTRTRSLLVLGALMVGGSLSACSGGQNVVTADGVATRAGKLSSGPINGAVLKIIKGTYGTGCMDPTNGSPRAFNEVWDLAANGEPETSLTNKLAVVLNNNLCHITITDLIFDTGITRVTYTSASLLGLAVEVNYQTTAVAFQDGVGADPDIFVNANKDIVGFESDFQLTINYSSDPNEVGATKEATYATVTATNVAVGTVAAPDYVPPLGLPGLIIQVDASKTVIGVSGSVTFTLNTAAPGESYAVRNSFVGDKSNINDVITAYNAGGTSSIAGPPYTSFLVNATDLNLVGADLSTPQFRYVIVKHTDSVLNISTYEVIEFKFVEPGF